MRYVTEDRAMPRGRKPEGEHVLSNAERQARHCARRLTQTTSVATRWRRPIDRRSRPRRWRDAVSELLALQAEYADWLAAPPDSLAASGGHVELAFPGDRTRYGSCRGCPGTWRSLR